MYEIELPIVSIDFAVFSRSCYQEVPPYCDCRLVPSDEGRGFVCSADTGGNIRMELIPKDWGIMEHELAEFHNCV